MALKLLTGAAGLAIAIGLAILIWTASRADGLVIKAFSVPPALAERGINGEAVASQLMDRLSAMAEAARSAETQRQVSAQLGQSISIQIPETGVSLSQIDQWLRDKLGHERRVTGELMAAKDGSLTLGARIGSSALPVQTGGDVDLPVLVQRNAEALYAREQPDSYGRFLSNQGRTDDAIAFARTRIGSRSVSEKALGYAALGVLLQPTDTLAAKAAYQRSIAIDPMASAEAMLNLGSIENGLGHQEAALALFTRVRALLDNPAAFRTLSPEGRRQRINVAVGQLTTSRGDFTSGLRQALEMSRSDLLGYGAGAAGAITLATQYRQLHDVTRARSILANFEPDNDVQRRNVRGNMGDIAADEEDWPGSLAARKASYAFNATTADKGAMLFVGHSNLAMALARVGRLAEADAMIASTPLDCAPCVTNRGRIAALEGKLDLADHWFKEGIRINPSRPQPAYMWGRALLERGDGARAAAQFQLANSKGPRWADPISYWGEALLKQGDAKAALAKFREADKIAPRWGRNHLKWGEALAKLGKSEEARAQFKVAAALDLTPTERAELARVQGAR